jgi:asparagine synthase (glutamine-hydrolysing)
MSSVSFFFSVISLGVRSGHYEAFERGLASIADLGPSEVNRPAVEVSAWVATGSDSRAGSGYFENDQVFGASVGFLVPRFEAIGPRFDFRNGLNARLMSGHAGQSLDGCAALSGEFSGFVFDKQSASLLIVRDHVGARPLFYCRRPEFWVVSTELRAVWSASGYLKADRRAIAALLQPANAFSVPPDRTGIAGIRRLRPGYYLEAVGDAVEIRRYWNPRKIVTNHAVGFEDAVEQVSVRFDHAVRARIPAEGLTASHLSGGIDSSTIALALRQAASEQGRETRYFSWTPASEVAVEASEEGRIRALARLAQMNVEFLDSTQCGEALKCFTQLDRILYPWNSLHLELGVLAAARKSGVKTLMSGWGGDEVVSYHARGVAMDLLRRGRVLKVLRNLGPRDGESLFAACRQLGHRVRWELLMPILSGERFIRRSSLDFASPDLRGELDVLWGPDEMLDVGRKLQTLQIRYLEGGYLAERMESWFCYSRFFGVDHVYPMLDRDLVEYVLSLPADVFIQRGRTRALFRAVARRYWGPVSVDDDLKDESCLLDRLPSLGLPDLSSAASPSGLDRWLDVEKYRAACSGSVGAGFHKAQHAIDLLHKFPEVAELDDCQ